MVPIIHVPRKLQDIVPSALLCTGQWPSGEEACHEPEEKYMEHEEDTT